MSTITTRTSRRRRIARGVAALAASAALTLAGVGAASAASTPTVLSRGHVDIVHVALNESGDKLVLGANVEAGTGAGYHPQADVGTGKVIFTVAQNKSGVCVIPAAQRDATGIWGGFAAAGEWSPGSVLPLDFAGYGVKDTVTVRFDRASGPGNVTIDFSGQPNTRPSTPQTNAGKFLFSNLGSGEAVHRHPAWTFTKDGTYTITFQAATSIPGVSASDVVTYTFDVRCGA